MFISSFNSTLSRLGLERPICDPPVIVLASPSMLFCPSWVELCGNMRRAFGTSARTRATTSSCCAPSSTRRASLPQKSLPTMPRGTLRPTFCSTLSSRTPFTPSVRIVFRSTAAIPLFFHSVPSYLRVVMWNRSTTMRGKLFSMLPDAMTVLVVLST